MRWILIDQILECEPGKRAQGVKCFTRSESFFSDHLQGSPPVVPGVLQVEMIAYLGGLCARDLNPRIRPKLACIKSAKFFKSIGPGDQCIVYIEIYSFADNYIVIQGGIRRGDEKIAEAKVISSITILPDSLPLDLSTIPVLYDWRNK